jgi:hypothetical protein
MDEAVEFGNDEVLPDFKLDKNVFVFMKSAQGSVHISETFRGVHWVLGEVDKIEERPHNAGQAC